MAAKRSVKSPTDAILDQEDKGPVASGIESLLGEMRSQPLSKKFPIVISGHVLYFRCPESSDDLRLVKTEGLDFMSRMKSKSALPLQMSEIMSIRDMTDEDIASAFMLHYWSHEDEKIDQAQALEMVARRPAVVATALQQIEHIVSGGMSVIAFGAVMSEKKDSPTTE